MHFQSHFGIHYLQKNNSPLLYHHKIKRNNMSVILNIERENIDKNLQLFYNACRSGQLQFIRKNKHLYNAEVYNKGLVHCVSSKKNRKVVKYLLHKSTDITAGFMEIASRGFCQYTKYFSKKLVKLYSDNLLEGAELLKKCYLECIRSCQNVFFTTLHHNKPTQIFHDHITVSEMYIYACKYNPEIIEKYFLETLNTDIIPLDIIQFGLHQTCIYQHSAIFAKIINKVNQYLSFDQIVALLEYSRDNRIIVDSIITLIDDTDWDRYSIIKAKHFCMLDMYASEKLEQIYMKYTGRSNKSDTYLCGYYVKAHLLYKEVSKNPFTL